MALRFGCFAAIYLLAGQSLAISAQQTGTPVPSPREVIGFRMGTDGELADWAQIVDYYQRVAEVSALVTVDTIGTSVLGRPMILAVVTSAENQRRIEEIRRDQARLADPRGLSRAERQRLVETQPAVGFVGATLHGNEILGTQFMVEFLHQLATDRELAGALSEVVMLLVPGMNPDGLDLTRDWFYRVRNTPHHDAPMPWLYHHYTGHDNNRDFYMITQPETRALSRVLYREWFPEVVWDVHQMGNRGERFFIPPFADPLNPNLDPLLVRMTNLVGTQMALDLTEAGKTGVSHRETFDLWWHGGGRTVPARHNMVGILSEAASAQYADPVFQEPDSLEQPETGSMYPDAWRGGWWRARDVVEYELIAGRSLVTLLSRQRETFVENFVRLAVRQLRKGRAGDPFGWLFPPDQRDPGSTAELLNVLRRGGVEVHQATAALQAGGERYPAGTRVVLAAQPYRLHAKDLLEPQSYPDRRRYPGGPPDPPYDAAGWTLPFQMGVELVRVDRPFDTAGLVALDSVPVPPGASGGKRAGAPGVALDPRLNSVHRAIHEVLKDGGRVTFSAAPVVAGKESWPAGTPVVSGVAGLDERVAAWSREWGIDSWGLAEIPAGRMLEGLRVALYKPWTASIDEGWTRWLFEEWGVPFDTLHDADLQRGLHGYHALVMPSLSHERIVEGLDRAHSDYAGGLGPEGVEAVRSFVADGGTLVLLNEASGFGLEVFGLPIRDLTAGRDEGDPEGWYSPGSILRVRWNLDHPVAHGMPPEGAVNYSRGPVFEVGPGAEEVTVIARFPDDPEEILMSGYALGAARVAGKPVLLEARVGEGRVILFGFRPQHRAQPHETFKPFFNALYTGVATSP
ncbi:MAG: M14 family metallopeptidase [Longimicrobiaceae bacterium]